MMLTRKQFEDLWVELEKSDPKCGIPNYDEHTESENMFEDYLDIFRGINTRMERPSSNRKWYYEHPFFDGDKPKLKNTPCIKYVMIGEARPKPNPPKINSCGGDENNTYFYNVTHLGATRWLKEPCEVFLPIYTKPTCPNQKANLLLQLASEGYILVDMFPFAISFNSKLRNRLNKTLVSDWFFTNYLDKKLVGLCKYKCVNFKPIVAFSGPAIIHHYIIHKIANRSLILNSCFVTFGTSNYFVAPHVTVPIALPPSTIAWIPIANTLNGKYFNLRGLKKAPFYRAGCWDAAFVGPHQLFIRNAFDLP